uniref:LamG domain-containing protein n=1 Tax=Chloroflexus sp. TaxID=1904827 RepID=UPI002FD941DE
DTTALLQVFNAREVIRWATVSLTASNVPTATTTTGPSPTATSPMPTPTATATVPTPTPTTTATATPAAGANFALSFVSSDQVRGAAIPGLAASHTLEFWFRPSATGQTGVVAASDATGATGWALELDNNRVVWWVLRTNGQWVAVQHPTTLTANTWHHLAVTYDATAGTARVFVNGAPGSATTVGAITAGPDLVLGGFTGYGFIAGQIDELRLSNSVRYAAAFTPPNTAFTVDVNTLALFSFNEGSGQITTDRSGNSRTLTLGTTINADAADPLWVTSTAPTGGALLPTVTATTTTPTTTATPPAPTATATAPTATATATATPAAGANFALSFVSSDQVRGAAIPGLAASHTLEFWFRPSATGQTGVVAASDATGATGWALELDNNRVVWWVLRTNGQWVAVQHPTTLTANTWHHLAVTYDATAGTARVFVNGAPGSATTVGAITAGPDLVLGGFTGYGFIAGQIDELRLSNSVRYAAAFTPPNTAFTVDVNTLALFSFNEGSGQITTDRSGNSRTLTLGTTINADTADPLWVTSTAPTAP